MDIELTEVLDTSTHSIVVKQTCVIEDQEFDRYISVIKLQTTKMYVAVIETKHSEEVITKGLWFFKDYCPEIYNHFNSEIYTSLKVRGRRLTS